MERLEQFAHYPGLAPIIEEFPQVPSYPHG
jgi:hypothetical protein